MRNAEQFHLCLRAFTFLNIFLVPSRTRNLARELPTIRTGLFENFDYGHRHASLVTRHSLGMSHRLTEPRHNHTLIRPCLLEPPLTIRHRVCELVGIFGASVAELSKCASQGCIFDLSGKRHQPEQVRPQFRGLLLSYRAIYQEASRLLYATHRFTIQLSAQNSLAPLCQLRTTSLGVLSRLQIILAEASCHCPGTGDWIFGHECCSDLKNVHCLNDVSRTCKRDHRHDPLIEGPNGSLLKEWEETVTSLGNTITAGTLNLAVVCDICPIAAGVQMAISVVASLLRLPKLRHLSIRLCQQPKPWLDQLAHDAELQTRHITSFPNKKTNTITSTSSRLFNLPTELRLRILSYADLITPWSEVAWSPTHGGLLASRTYCDDLAFAGASCPPDLHHGYQFSRCYITYPKPSDGCFCRLQHSAFSSATADKCWEPPQALFLLCKILRLDAQAVFYAGNRFVVHDDSQSITRNATAVVSRSL